jgi:YidC/Oxa1 family membrane protein insertase
MEKRIFIAILVSVAVLWLWAAIAPKLFPDLVKKPAPVTQTQTTSTTSTAKPADSTAPATSTAATTTAATSTAAPATTSAISAAVTPVRAAREQFTVHDTRDYTAIFTNRGAQLVSFKLKNYSEKRTGDPVELVRPIQSAHRRYPFSIDVAVAQKAIGDELNDSLYEVSERRDANAHIIEYRYVSPGGVRATKTFRFGTRPFLFDFAVDLPSNVAYRVAIGPGIRALDPVEAKAELEGKQVVPVGNGVIQSDGDFELLGREKANNVQAFQPIDYIGLEDNYFLAVLRPQHAGAGVLQRVEVHDKADAKRHVRQLRAALNSVDGVIRGEAYFGPKETAILDGYGFGEALQFGWFGPIARFFLTALLWINKFTHNYGWAIVVLTILIKIVLYPLQHKSIVSMKKMQRVQPKMEAIKSKYKKARTDPEQRQKMNVEMMQLYQKEGINPMAGCFPILLQMPILFGFYGLLSRAIELRGADFMLWIKDLSEKDPYYVTPILMTITMFIQTYITPSTGDPMQRRMFLIMPFIFGFFFKDFPSGLVLYWLVQNILTIVQQMIMNKWWKDHPEEIQKA